MTPVELKQWRADHHLTNHRQGDRKMKLFRDDNTEGYIPLQEEELNREWALRVKILGIEENTDEYYQNEKAFCDEAARR